MSLLALVTACGRSTLAPTALPPTLTPPVAQTAVPTPLPAPPTPTPEPLAALVNGAPITLAAYQQEVARCQAGLAAANLDPATCPAEALQSLIEQRVVEEAATAVGLVVTDADVESRLAQITQAVGGAEAFTTWLSANQYTEADFREALRRDILHARMTARIAGDVGETAEQVHALALVVADEATAQALLERLKGGADFATLAVEHSLDLSSRAAGGDLSWFPRGVLTRPEVEQAAFALQPGETSAVIHSPLGYHIVRVLERDAARPLSASAAQTLRERAVRAWLDDLLTEAVVEKFVTP